MSQSIAAFLLQALHPSSVASPGEVPAPEFVEDMLSWNQLLEFSQRLHTDLPLALVLEQVSWSKEIPTPVRKEWEARKLAGMGKLEILDLELERALSLLLDARMPVIVFRGMDWGRRFYPERIVRPMSNVDLLVPSDSFSDALRALGRGGYRVTGQYHPGDTEANVAFGAQGAEVQVHKFLFLDDTHDTVAEVWERSLENQFPGLPRSVRALSIEDTFIYLIRQGAIENLFESPVWLNDLHYLLSHESSTGTFRWENVAARLRESGSVTAAWFTLQFLSNNWGTPVAPAALDLLGTGVSSMKRRLLERAMKGPNWFPVDGRTFSWRARSNLLLRENALTALRASLRS